MVPGTKKPLEVQPPAAQRVRTGCLTCRARHLKCDEARPRCRNCRRSKRDCKRGLRLNFSNVRVHNLGPHPQPKDWEGTFTFHDESEDVASEYKNGFPKKSSGSRAVTAKTERGLPKMKETTQQQYQTSDTKASVCSQLLPPLKVTLASSVEKSRKRPRRRGNRAHKLPNSCSDTLLLGSRGQASSTGNELEASESMAQQTMARMEELMPIKEEATLNKNSQKDGWNGLPTVPQTSQNLLAITDLSKILLNEDWRPPGMFDNSKPEEYLYDINQVSFTKEFTESISQWMDSFEGGMQFSHNLPYKALDNAMLLNAMYACGAKRKLGDLKKNEYDWALLYYSTATTKLLDNCICPERNTVDCAITSVVLNVYETMADIPNEKAPHIKGSRALIKQCNWNASSGGLGGACFWLNIGLEILDCLASGSKLTWDPKEWGFDMPLNLHAPKDDTQDRQTAWLHYILYIVAETINYRARGVNVGPGDGSVRVGKHLPEWDELKALCDSWNDSCPVSMRPLGYYPSQDTPFPDVWIVPPTAVVARIFYHVVQYLLSETNPLGQIEYSEEMRRMRLHHARHVCGIVAMSRKSDIPGIAVQCLALVGMALTVRTDQEAVIRQLEEVREKSGWNLRQADVKLKTAWGWDGSQRVKREALTPPGPFLQLPAPWSTGSHRPRMGPG